MQPGELVLVTSLAAVISGLTAREIMHFWRWKRTLQREIFKQSQGR